MLFRVRRGLYVTINLVKHVVKGTTLIDFNCLITQRPAFSWFFDSVVNS